MNIATEILKSEHVGIRELKKHLSEYINEEKLIVVTKRGKPVEVLLPYEDLLELTDIIDELSDPDALQLVSEGRKAIKKGNKGISVKEII
jgi:prevent-host-death family protein